MTAVGNFFSGVYTKAEAGFYGVMDAIETRGIPVYNYIEFLEKKGVPAFPFTVGLLFVLLFAVFFLFAMSGQTVTVTASFSDGEGGVINQVQLQIQNESGNTVFDSTIDSQTPADLTGKVRVGESVTLTAAHSGYTTSTKIIDRITPGDNPVTVTLAKPVEYLTVFVALKDADTATIIKEADMVANVAGESSPITGVLGTDGRFAFAAIPKGKMVSFTIKPKNYNDPGVLTHTFYEDQQVLPISLSAKAEFAAGTSTLSVSVTDDKGQLLSDATIQLFDATTNTRISSDVASQGTLHQELKNGTAVRVVVSKEGYQTYDSATLNENKTMRNAEEAWKVVLSKGGAIAKVLVKSQSGDVMMDAQVILWNETFDVVDDNETGFSGGVTFSGLDRNFAYVVSAYKENFLPSKKTVEFDKENVLVLHEATIQNSAFVSVTVLDEFGSVVSNAKVMTLEQTGTTLSPLGSPVLETDVTGVVSIRAPIGDTLMILARKDTAEGSGTVSVTAQGATLSIILVKDPTVKTIRVTDLGGTEISNARITVTCTDGSLIFDGNLDSTGKASFDAGNCREGLVHLESNGRVQDISASFQGSSLINVVFEGKDVSGFAPEVTFVGIQNENGDDLPGIARNSDAYLVFSVNWPKGDYTGGMHVRVGDDAIKNALSQPVTITGFSSNAAEISFGKTYNAPNNSAIDLQNTAKAGEPAKWVNASWNHPVGKTIVKVKVHAASNLEKGNVTVHYRAFIDAFGKFYRNPNDEKIGLAAGVEERHGLYAQTTNLDIQTFEGQLQTCSENVCLYLSVTDALGNRYEWKDFYASVGKTYFLQATVDTKKAGAGTISTQVEPVGLIGLGSWTSTMAGIVPGFSDTNNANSTLPITISNPGQPGTWGMSFTALREGSVKMRVTATVGNESAIESRAFLVSLDKKMKVTLSPNPGRVGDKIQVTIKSDDNKFTPVENATIVFADGVGNEAYRLVGNGTSQKGKKGRYVIPASLKASTYQVTVTAKGFETQVIPFEIAVDDALVFEGDGYVKIPASTHTGNANLSLINHTELNGTEIVYQITGLEQFKDFAVSVNGPSVISAQQAGDVRISATYNGKETQARASGTLEAIGQLEDGTLTIAKSPLSIEFNPTLDPNCLEIVPADLKVTLFSEAGSEKQVPLTLRNNCSTDPLDSITLTARVQGSVSPNEMSISTPDVTLAGGEEKVVSILVTNRIDRQAVERQNVEFSITFANASITKSVPLHVQLISKRLALSFPNTITVYVSQTIRGQAEEVVAPFTVRNASNVPVQNLTFTLRSGTIEGVAITPNPATGIPNLNPGQTIPGYLVIKSDVEKSKIVKDELIIRGSVDGKSYDLGRINVIVNASSPSCLRVNTAKLNYQSDISDAGIGFEGETITLQNNCGQEVQIVDVTPRNFGSNGIMLQPADNFLTPIIPIGGVARYKVLLTKQQSMKTTGSLFITGLLLSPQIGPSGFKRVTTDPIPVSINLGSTTGEDTLSENEIDLPVCEDTTGSEKIKIKFPKIAQSGDSCSTAYCDASQAAVFILDKVQKMYNVSESKLLEKNNSTLGTACVNQAACDLREFGVDNESFLLYLQNDFLTPELIHDTIEKNDRFSSLRGFETVLGTLPGFGFGRSLVLPEMRGCGKYSLELTGAVETLGINVQPGRETFLLQIKGDRGKIVTKECEARIQNVANFLPVDNSPSGGVRNYRDRQGTWLGMIDSTNELVKEGKMISKAVFGSEERYQNGSSNVNNVYVSTDPGISRLVKISFESGGSNGPVRINAQINDDVFVKNKEQAAVEVGQVLAALKNKNPASGSCIGRDQTYLGLVSGDSKLGGLPVVSDCRVDFAEIVGRTQNPIAPKIPLNQLRVIGNGQEQCCTFTVTGVSRTQKILPKLADGSFADPRDPVVLGVKGLPIIRDKQSGADVTTQSGGYELNPLPTVGPDGKNVSVFKRDFQLCATGDEATFPNLAFQKGQNIYVVATDLTGNGSNEQLDSLAKEVNVNMCGIHPYDLMGRLIQESETRSTTGTSKTFLATVVWSGDPNTANFRSVYLDMVNDPIEQKRMNGKSLRGFGLNGDEGISGKVEVAKAELQPMVPYFAACAGTRIIGNGVLGLFTGGYGWITGGISIITDCGIPVAYAVTEKLRNVDNDVIRETVGRMAGAVGDWMADFFGIETGQETDVDVLEAAGTGIISSTARAPFIGPGGLIKGEQLSKQIADFLIRFKGEEIDITAAASGKYQAVSVTKVNGDVVALTTEVGTLKGQLAPLQTRIDALTVPGATKGDVAVAKLLQDEKKTLLAEISSKEKALAEATEKLSERTKQIDSVIDVIKSENSQLADEYGKLQGKIGGKNITPLQQTYTSNQIAIETLEKAKTEISTGNYARAEEFLKKVSGQPKGLTQNIIFDAATGTVKESGVVRTLVTEADLSTALKSNIAKKVTIGAGGKLLGGAKAILTLGADVGIGYLANVIGLQAYKYFYDRTVVENIIHIKSTQNDTSTFAWEKYHTYQVTIQYNSATQKPNWTIDKVSEGTTFPKDAVVLPENCDYTAFDRGLGFTTNTGTVVPVETPTAETATPVPA